MKKITVYLHIAVLIPFLIITIFLFRFQILEGEKYQRIAEHNFVRVQRILPVRGEIFDRNFNPIATNRASSNLYVVPARIEDIGKLAAFVNHYFPSLSEARLRQMIYEQRFRSYQELLLVQNISYETVVEVSERLVDYPSLFFRNEHIRSYSFNNHFTGYVNKISPAELEQHRDQGYTINSLIGKTGLEKKYEEILRGEVGFRVIQVDATGRSYQLFKHNITTPAVRGNDILLTIDSRLQNYIEEIFPEGHNGAVIVTDPQSGGILAYVSRPVYNLNMFSETIGTEYWQSLVNDPDSPLLDRVSMANYPPASAFKPVIAAAALDYGIVTPDAKYTCTGSLRYGNRVFNCWLERGHGSLDLIEGIKHSCNVYFYNLSQEISLPILYDFVMSNKLTARTGIDLLTERTGLFPDENWYLSRGVARISITGHKINLSIGQGEVLLTPLQIVSFYSAIANNGLWRQPYLFSRRIGADDSDDAQVYHSLYPEKGTRQLDIKPETIELLQSVLDKAVNETGGTGGAARVRGVRVSGKTGTGQNPGTKTPNAWFAGYAAWEKPELAFAIIIEKVPEGGGGGRNAAPLAGQIIRFYNENIRTIREHL